MYGEKEQETLQIDIRGDGPIKQVQGAGCRVQGAGCRVQGAGCRVQGARSRVQE